MEASSVLPNGGVLPASQESAGLREGLGFDSWDLLTLEAWPFPEPADSPPPLCTYQPSQRPLPPLPSVATPWQVPDNWVQPHSPSATKVLTLAISKLGSPASAAPPVETTVKGLATFSTRSCDFLTDLVLPNPRGTYAPWSQETVSKISSIVPCAHLCVSAPRAKTNPRCLPTHSCAPGQNPPGFFAVRPV